MSSLQYGGTAPVNERRRGQIAGPTPRRRYGDWWVNRFNWLAFASMWGVVGISLLLYYLINSLG